MHLGNRINARADHQTLGGSLLCSRVHLWESAPNIAQMPLASVGSYDRRPSFWTLKSIFNVALAANWCDVAAVVTSVAPHWQRWRIVMDLIRRARLTIKHGRLLWPDSPQHRPISETNNLYPYSIFSTSNQTRSTRMRSYISISLLAVALISVGLQLASSTSIEAGCVRGDPINVPEGGHTCTEECAKRGYSCASGPLSTLGRHGARCCCKSGHCAIHQTKAPESGRPLSVESNCEQRSFSVVQGGTCNHQCQIHGFKSGKGPYRSNQHAEPKCCCNTSKHV